MAKKKKIAKRVFASGGYRDDDIEKLQFRRCLSHRVLFAFAEFMRKHNTLKDGSRRNESNWKKGFPEESFMDSKFRHFMETWKIYEETISKEDIIESLCAEFFNIQGWLDLLLNDDVTLEQFKKVYGDNVKKKVIDTRTQIRKEKDKEHFEKTLKRIEQRKKERKEKKTHYKPLDRLNTPMCGNTRLNLKTTPHNYHATCKTCKKIIKGQKL